MSTRLFLCVVKGVIDVYLLTKIYNCIKLIKNKSLGYSNKNVLINQWNRTARNKCEHFGKIDVMMHMLPEIDGIKINYSTVLFQ